MTKIGIIMPVRNCLEYTKAALQSVKTIHETEIIVISDRSNDGTNEWLQAESSIHGLIDPPSTGLAANWNTGIRLALTLGCTHFLVVNNDILFNPHTIDNLVARFERSPYVLMATGVNSQGACPNPTDIFTLTLGEDTEAEHPDFSCFMITPDTIEKIGFFDENFRGAYCEDCDYHARIVIAGEKAITLNIAPYYHYASQTLKSNPHLAQEIMARHNENQAYLAQKWGHGIVSEPGQMRQVYFQHPFNNPEKTIKDW